MSNLNDFENILGYRFKNIKLLSIALTHSSYANEHNLESNERMEFLGDAVLELVTSKYLYESKDLDEGGLTKIRAKAVCEVALDIYAKELQISKFLLLGKGEEAQGGRNKPAVIADAVEAVLGAIFLDSNLDEVDKVYKKFFLPYLNEVIKFKDYKSLLQEKLQSEKRTIRYEIVRDEGPANNKIFEAVVYMDEILMGRGTGKTKKEAQMQAAKDALEKEAPHA